MGVLLALLATLAQDATGVPDLLRNLEDDRLEVREQAQRTLVELGDAALPALAAARKAAKGEAAVRLDEILSQIEFSAKIKSIYRELPRVTLKTAERPLGEVLAELTRQTGARFDAGAVDPNLPVTLDVTAEPLLRVLDRICEGRLDCTPDLGQDADIRLLRDVHPPCPSFYEGPFRIRAVQVYALRGVDFKVLKASATLTLMADWERQLKPSPNPSWEIIRAWDDRNNPLETTRTSSNFTILPGLGNQRLRLNLMGGPAVGGAGSAPHSMIVTGFDPGARRFGLEGKVTFAFPIDPRTVRFAEPGAEQTQDCGDSAFTLRRLGSGPLWQLLISPTRGRPTGWADSIPGRLTLDAVTAVDSDGQEMVGRLQPVSASGRGIESDSTLIYQLALPRQGKPLKELRFPFVAQVHLKTVPFEIRDIPLP